MGDSIADALAALRGVIDRFDEAGPADGLWSPPDGRRPDPTGVAGHELRWAELDSQLGGQVAHRRILVVGPSADYDAIAFAGRDAKQVVALEFPEEIRAASLGTFEIVHCDGLLHRVTEPIALLRRLRDLTVAGGTLLIGSMVIADPERSEYLRFIPDRYAGDPSWWFVPGRLAFRWLVQTAGFEVQSEFGEREGPGDLIPLVATYLRATAV